MGTTTRGNSGDTRNRELLELSVLAEIGQLMTSAPDINAAYDRFAEITAPLLPFDRISIAEIDTDAGTMTTNYEAGVSVETWGSWEDAADVRAVDPVRA